MHCTPETAPSKSILAYALALLCVSSIVGFGTGCDRGTQLQPTFVQVKPQVLTIPLSLAIVPGRGGITIARNKPDEFYVLLSNVSKQPQTVWEDWNSWGYQAISFELTTADGKKFTVSRRQEEFTVNFPSTFLIEPGEHQVYAIRLDEQWETHPSLPKTDKMPITLKAIYEVSPTPEATQYKVWIGRLESRTYNFTLRQW